LAPSTAWAAERCATPPASPTACCNGPCGRWARACSTGLIPFGSKLRDYFDRYQSSQSHLNAIIQSLYRGQNELRKDNAAIEQEKVNLWTTMGRLQQYALMAQRLDQALEERIAGLEASDPERARVLREDVLFYVRQKHQDLLTQLALDLVRKNNLELVKGVDRATTTTVAALRTAVMVAQALANQKHALHRRRAGERGRQGAQLPRARPGQRGHRARRARRRRAGAADHLREELRTPMQAPRRAALAAGALAAALLLGACTGGGRSASPATPGQAQPSGPATTLRVLAGSELKDVEPLLSDIRKATGVSLRLEYVGTLDGAERIAAGRGTDLAWFSSARYLTLLTQAGGKGRPVASQRIMLSPVVLGVKQSVAKRFGWSGNPNATWKDIADKARAGQLHYGMTNPAATPTSARNIRTPSRREVVPVAVELRWRSGQ
jgi:toxic anion resistance protein TelA/extracellular solute-binding protein